MCGEGRPGIEATVLFAVECRRPLDDERVYSVSSFYRREFLEECGVDSPNDKMSIVHHSAMMGFVQGFTREVMTMTTIYSEMINAHTHTFTYTFAHTHEHTEYWRISPDLWHHTYMYTHTHTAWY